MCQNIFNLSEKKLDFYIIELNFLITYNLSVRYACNAVD